MQTRVRQTLQSASNILRTLRKVVAPTCSAKCSPGDSETALLDKWCELEYHMSAGGWLHFSVDFIAHRMHAELGSAKLSVRYLDCNHELK